MQSGNVMHKPISGKTPAYQLMSIGVIVLAIFALYAPAIRLMLFHDDAANIVWMNAFNMLSIFSMAGQTGASARPVVNLLWVLTREVFGWYIPAIIHAWNVWLHVLNTALVAALALRLGRRFHIRGLLFPALSALIFGLFPFSYQAVLWAGAIYHPVLTLFGLSAVHAYLTARHRNQPAWWLLCIAFLALACLSHEAGFMFGPLIVTMELVMSVAGQRPVRLRAIAIGVLCLIYPLQYRLLRPDSWGLSQIRSLATLSSRLVSNIPYVLQAMISWLIVLLRSWIGLAPYNALIVSAMFVVIVPLTLVWLVKRRNFALGLLALAWWFTLSVPSLILSEGYLPMSPRLLYAPSVGIALFWAGALALLLQNLRQRVVQVIAVLPVVIILGWCVPYVADRMNETARLTPAMTMINTDLRASSPAAKVLYINMPYYSAPAYPAFLIGAEGMPIFQSDNIPAWTWLATVSGTRRDTSYVRHNISLTRGTHFVYGIPGPIVNDIALRQAILASNYIYRFDYDSPGLRARRLAVIGNDRTSAPPLARFEQGALDVALRQAKATMCEQFVALDLTWSDVRDVHQPLGVFVHGIDHLGQQAIVADRDLLEGYLPLDQVPADRVITETRRIELPSGIAPLKEFQIGVYLRANGNRLTTLRADGSAWVGDAVNVPLGPYSPAVCRRSGG